MSNNLEYLTSQTSYYRLKHDSVSTEPVSTQSVSNSSPSEESIGVVHTTLKKLYQLWYDYISIRGLPHEKEL